MLYSPRRECAQVSSVVMLKPFVLIRAACVPKTAGWSSRGQLNKQEQHDLPMAQSFTLL